jgi:hypothetical protein
MTDPNTPILHHEVVQPGFDPFHPDQPPPPHPEISAFIRNGDIQQLRQIHHDSPGTILFQHYAISLPESIVHSECIEFLCEIGVIHPHQLLLDAAAFGNLRLIRYAEHHGEDITYYKVLMLAMNNHPICVHYIISRMPGWSFWGKMGFFIEALFGMYILRPIGYIVSLFYRRRVAFVAH